MKRLSMSVLLLTFLMSGAALAQNDSGFGLGAMIGEPSGFSAKLWTTHQNSFNFGAALSLLNDSDITLQGDYVWYKWDLIDMDKGRMPFYFGIGARWRKRDVGDDNFGARVPIGLNYLFPNSHFDLFGEVVPILDLAPDTEFRLGGAIGGRYFF
jgi:hypothetical protein